MARVTRATFKSFLKKNDGNLYIMKKSNFDGMVDGIAYDQAPQYQTLPLASERVGCLDNTLGYKGVWLVGGGRDQFTEVNSDGFVGYEVYNCCGCFTVVKRA